MAKFIFITGGVVSGLGKGLTAASLGVLLKARGFRVSIQKFEPYLNVDSSNLSPYQHGEVFVTDDGGESDLVIGHYERFLDEDLSSDNDITSGKVYSTVIENERKGLYDGGTVQVVPHITDEIKSRIYHLNNDKTDIVIVEVGGTTGDIESNPFLEAIRQCRPELGKNNVMYIHVTLVPYISVSAEQKTKPTQHSVKELQNMGIQPDVIVCRSDFELISASREKLALFCNVEKDCIIQNLTTDNIYEIPLMLEQEKLPDVIMRKLSLPQNSPDLTAWEAFYRKSVELESAENPVKIAVIGKYADKHGAYISLIEALTHSGIAISRRVSINTIFCDNMGDKEIAALSNYDGVIIPSGFGERGFDEKVRALKSLRENNIPTLMIGMGAQAALVEFARNVLGLPNANSAEVCDTPDPVVMRNKKQEFIKGAYPTNLKKGSRLAQIYDSGKISERHRHKYSFNPAYTKQMEKKGLGFTAVSAVTKLPEGFELKNHRFYIGTIFRPELKSRPLKPHPLITAFLKEAAKTR